MTWNPPEPVVIAGYTLTRDEAWLRECTREWFRLARGLANEESLADWAIEILAKDGARDPVEVAQAEWAGRSAGRS
jgi:hypothetical protein